MQRRNDLVRMATAGSVDDGRSTLIGRLLFDTGAVYEDQVRAVEQASRRKGFTDIDLSLFTDGLAAEREQQITIDVAYRYLSTARWRFVIADVPGHEEYTRNMVTGGSTADVALVLVDARRGVVTQSRRGRRRAVARDEPREGDLRLRRRRGRGVGGAGHLGDACRRRGREPRQHDNR